MANDFLKNFFSEIDRSGVLHLKHDDGKIDTIVNLKPEMQLLKTAIKENIHQTIAIQDPKFPSLVGSKSSYLVYVAIDHINFELYCIDRDLFVR